MSDGWGYAVYADGSTVPLGPPPGLIPEDERERVIDTPGLVLWTKRGASDGQ